MREEAEEETGIILRTVGSMQSFSPDEWAQFCETSRHSSTTSETGSLATNKSYNPFLSYAYLSALEDLAA